MTTPCTAEEIKKKMRELHEEYDEQLKNPRIFWEEMGINYAGGSTNE